jgi:competence protein ComEA
MAEVQTRLDPNTADWADLVRLPRIGEILAKRIVAYREQQVASGVESPVFRSLEDLDAVKGIGPKTLERIAEFICFPAVDGEMRLDSPMSRPVDTFAQPAVE